MFENRPFGFIGQSSFVPNKSDVKTPFSPERKTSGISPGKGLITTDNNLVNSLLLKNNNNPFGINFFAMPENASANQKPPGKTTELPDYKIDDQGDTNSCGTTSLTSVLNYFGANLKDHWEIDKSIRSIRFDMFTTPQDIVSYARSKGFKAGLKNNGSVEDLATFIDKGVPVIVLIDPSGEYNFNMHWQVVKGYEKNEKGEIDSVTIADPSGGWSYSQDIDTFKKQWGNMRVGFEKLPVIGKKSFSTGYNNLMIPVVPENKVIKAPDGTPVNTASIKISDQQDTIQGQGAHLVARGAMVIDKTLGAGKYIGDKAVSLAKKLGL